MHLDKKLIRKEYCSHTKKESNCTKEAGVVVESTQQEIRAIKFIITIECSNDKPHPYKEFYQQLGRSALIKGSKKNQKKNAAYSTEEKLKIK